MPTPPHPLPSKIAAKAATELDPIEREIYQQELVEGHARYIEEHHAKRVYRVTDEAELLRRLEEAQSGLEIKLTEKSGEIESLVNRHRPLRNELVDRRILQLVSGKLEPIVLSGKGPIAKALLERDRRPLIRRNPYLSDEMIDEVLRDAIVYFELSLKRTLHLHIRKAMKEGRHHDAGVLANWKLEMPSEEYIEVLLFAKNMGRLPRDEQQSLLLRLAEGKMNGDEVRQALIAMPVGSGKTHYLGPILRAKDPKASITIVPDKLADGERRQQAITMSEGWGYQIGAPNLSLRARTEVSLQDFDKVLKQAVDRNEKLVLIPKTLHSLSLHRKRACLQESGAEQRARAEHLIDRVARVSEMHIDEAREVLGAKTIVIEATDPGAPIDPLLIECQIHLFKLLFSLRESQALRIRENQMGEVSKETIQHVMDLLGEEVLRNQPTGLGIPKQLHMATRKYWRTGIRPGWLKKKALGAESASLTVFIGQFLRVTLQIAAQKKAGVDFNMERLRGEDYKPWNYQQPTGADYLDPQLAMTMTLLGTFQYGLRPFQRERLLQLLKQRIRQERKLYRTSEECPTQQLYNEWAGHDPRDILDLRALPEEVATNQEVLFWYLENIVLLNMRVRNNYISSTAAHLLNLFGPSATLFSACPGALEGYPFLTEPQVVKADAFQAEMVSLFCSAENNKVIEFDSPEPIALFRSLAEQDREAWEDLQAVMDPGVICQVGTTPADVASAITQVARDTRKQLDGVVYYQKGVRMFLRPGPGEKGIALGGGSLSEALKQIGLEYQEMKVLVLFGPAQVIGTDILLKDGDLCLLMEKPGETASDRTQKAGRARGAREGKQTFLYGRVRIDGMEEVRDAEDLVISSIENEVKLRREEIIMTAHQTIAFLIEQEAFRLATSDHDLKLQGVKETIPLDPFDRYPEPKRNQSTEEALEELIETTLERFSLDRDELSDEVQAQLASIIARTAELVPSMDRHLGDGGGVDQTIHVTQQTTLQQVDQTTIVQCRGVGIPGLSAEEDRPSPLITFLHPTADSLVRNRSMVTPVSELYDSSFFDKDLYYSTSALEVAKGSDGNGLREQVLRPIHFLWLAQKRDGRFVAIALSDTDTRHLAQIFPRARDKHCCPPGLLLGIDGQVIRRTQGELLVEDDEIDQEWLREILVQLNLLRGEIHDYAALRNRIATHPDITEVWMGNGETQGIRDALHFANPAAISAISELTTDIN